MTALIVFIIGMIIIIGWRNYEIEKERKKEEPLEDYISRIAVKKIDEILKKADEIAEKNGIDLNENDTDK